MIKLLSFIIEIRDAIILLICILFSIVLMVGSESDPGAPFRQITLNTIGKIGGYIYRIDSYFNLRTKVQELKERNAVLALKNLELEDALLENIRLRKMLDFKDKTKYRLIPAEVIGQNPQSIINGLILNEGTERNLEKGNAVFTADGLVGKLVKVDSDNSLCQILLDRNSRISAKIQRNRELGIISWDGGEMLKLLYVAKTIQVIVGDVILTSGQSRIFPENIKIGVVVDVSLESEGLFQNVTVQPLVNFNRLEEVFIVKKERVNGGD